jgi:two-component system, chemotaxis family, chemotaxis protein CheY
MKPFGLMHQFVSDKESNTIILMVKPGRITMKILIVDDNQNTRNLIRSILKPFGHEIIESHNGSDAVHTYASVLPDCVLMDYEMEGMDGIRATGKIRETFPQARIIIVTTFDDAMLREASVKAGAAHYVLKEDLMVLPGLLDG